MQLTNIKTLLSQSLDEEALTEKQKSVLQASLKLFAEKGFNDTKTSDIAILAGVAEGTVYKHFKTKENILNSILSPFIKGVIPRAANEFIAELKSKSFVTLRDLLEYIIKDRLTFAEENQFIAKIFIQELFQKPEVSKQLMSVIKQRILVSMNPILNDLKNRNELINISTMKFFQYLFSIVVGYIIPVILTNNYQNIDIDNITNESVDFLIHGMKP
ncbi:TetR/AcrR family transcriptional regulator [Apilactobacillus micheneri]|uniref:TetR/AcrR family transcriptional regulator n=1 Tax=Apilactobacillus micheneri TaxID=1899430 RepID=UPI00112BE266|nr:TetR/AcrR family transcriptional regulator [Apilactobacillus micheneri]TPR41686.1 TetR/AcrR family transcriptional regulator [Apilactobacillus micheneri]TPR50934.1 TetR/AcrR family transcriptional regulator [Apilactobacillus micheneri]